ALRFAWFYLIRGRHTPGAPLTPEGRWTPEAANYVAEVMYLIKQMHGKRADALARDPASQNAMAALNLVDETADDFTRADFARQVAREVAPGSTPTDRLKRVIVARELGLLARETGENPGRLLGDLAEEQAEAFDQFREASDPKRYATPFHPNGPKGLLPRADHDLVEYAKTLVKTGGAASPIPSGFAALDPIGRARREL